MSFISNTNSFSQLLEGPLPKFAKPVDPKLRCGICKGLLKQPRQTDCGHRFCYDCIQQKLEANGLSMRCPLNDQYCELITPETLYPDPAAIREIVRMPVKCTYEKNGCTTEVPWLKLESHKGQCQYVSVDCPYKEYGCKEQLGKSQLEGHRQTCQYEPVQCNLCNEKIGKCRMEEHNNKECPMAYVWCPYSCGSGQLLRRDLDAHLNQCPAGPTDCKYKSFGCSFKAVASELERHEEEAMSRHLDFVVYKYARLDLNNTELREKLQEIDSKRELMMSALNRTKEENVEIRQALQINETKIKTLQRLAADQGAKLLQVEKVLSEKVDAEEMRRLHADVKEAREKAQVAMQTINSTGSANRTLQNSLYQAEKQIGVHDVRLADMDLRFQVMESTSINGVLIWKISDYSRRKRDAIAGKSTSLYSQPFYTGRYGYKMCARIYLDGDGIGKGSHLSLFFVVMRGEYDALLKWPFRQKVTLWLLDQSGSEKHLCDTFIPDAKSSSFRKPLTEMNVASGCPKFASQSVVESPTYCKDDVIFIKVKVDAEDMRDLPVL